METKLLKVQARYLKRPILAFSGNKQPLQGKDYGKRAGWQLTGVKFRNISQSGKLRLDIIRLNVKYEDEPKIKAFADLLTIELRKYGFNVSNSDPCKIEGTTSGTTRQQLKANLDNAYSRLGRPSLVLVVLPKRDIPLYSDVKW